MKRTYFALALVLLAAGACASNGEGEGESPDAEAAAAAGTEATEGAAAAEEAEPTGAVAAEDMPVDCAERAAAAFSVPQEDIVVAPTDTSGGIFTIVGQYPPEGEDVKGFQCQFDPNGNFISVIPL